MNECSYLVLGAGEIGPAIAYWLLRQQDTYRVTIADADHRRAQDAVLRVATEEDIYRNRCIAAHLDVSAAAEREITALFSGVNTVISAIPASYSPALAALAIGVQTHFCDLGGVTRTSLQMRRDLNGLAKQHRITVIHDNGLAPGLSGMMTQVLFHYLGDARRIITYVGGLPRFPQERSFNWQRTFSTEGLVELLGPALTLREGALVYAPPCSGGTILDIPALAQHFPTPFGSTVKTRITAGAGVTPEVMQKLGVQDCWEETIRWDWDAFLQFIETVPAEQRVRALDERLPHTGPDFPDIAVMKVVATARDGSTAGYDFIGTYSNPLRMSAMARVTGFTAAAVARLAAQGGTPPGVMAPEELPWRQNGELITKLSEDLDICFRGD